MSEPRSFQSVLDEVPNVVDFLYRNPPKSALNVFTVMMPAEVVRPEFTTWRDEQRSWREAIALHDQSYHMSSLHVRGADALRVFERLGINGFGAFAPGAAKQFVACSPEGYVIGDAILYYLEPEHLLLVGNPASTDWVQFNCERGELAVAAQLDPIWVLNKERRRSFYRYQVEGPQALDLLEELNGGPLPEIKFFRSDWLTIAGLRVRAMRHSMGGVPGLELSGPWDDRHTVKTALVEAGRHYGLRQIGSLAYFSTGLNQFLVKQKGIQLGGLKRFLDDRLRFEASANYDFGNATQPYRPAESARLRGAPRAVYQVVLPDQPDAGYVVVYEFPDAAAAVDAGNEEAGYLGTGNGRVQFPFGTQHVLRQLGPTLILYSWLPAASSDPTAGKVADALNTLGIGFTVPS